MQLDWRAVIAFQFHQHLIVSMVMFDTHLYFVHNDVQSKIGKTSDGKFVIFPRFESDDGKFDGDDFFETEDELKAFIELSPIAEYFR